jgi:hypothetical protein
MSRRTRSHGAQSWIVFVMVLAAGTLFVPAAPARADEEAACFLADRPVLDDPEVGIPGDDDQPTIQGRKRNIVITTSQPAPSGSHAGNRFRTELRERFTRRIEALRALLRRSWVMLR